jgi:hypothetical protein
MMLPMPLPLLQPDEVGPAGYLGIPEMIKRQHDYPPVLAAFWD